MRGLLKSAFDRVYKKRVPLMSMLLIAVIFSATLLFNSMNIFTVTDGKSTNIIRTFSNSIENAVKVAGFSADKYRVLSVNTVGNKTDVNLAYTFPVYITSGDETKTVNSIEMTVADILKDAGYSVDAYDMVEPALDTVISDTAYIDYTNIDYVTGSYTETIPCSVKTVYSKTMEEGTKTVKEGVNGEQQVNYTAKIVNGVTVEKVIDSTITLSSPVNAVETIGTKKKTVAVTTSENVKSVSTLAAPFTIELDANGNPVNYKKHITTQATAYTYTGNKCATGVTPQPGYIAVNPNVIPYGTKMYIKSSDGAYIYGYAVAADTGGFVNSRPGNVDLFMSSKAACTAFGRRNVEIYILE